MSTPKQLEYQRRYYKEHKEKVLARQKAYYEAHPEKALEKYRKYNETHKDVRKAYYDKKKAAKNIESEDPGKEVE